MRINQNQLDIATITPDEAKKISSVIEFGVATFFDFEFFIAFVDDRLVMLEFIANDFDLQLDDLAFAFPKAQIKINQAKAEHLLKIIFVEEFENIPLFILLCGTPFQTKVWSHLTSISRGTVTTYSDIAQSIDAPKAVQAVGNAVGRNNIALVVPCHRVINKDGKMGNYKWGEELKAFLLESEKI